jgi:hypothetical protein
MSIVDLSIKVAAQAVDKAALAHGIPGGGIVTEALLKQLLLVQDEQAVALSRIDENVQRLIDGPWKTAKLYIIEAAQHGLTSEKMCEKLKLAAEHLHNALPLQEERTFGQAYVCIDLAVVFTMLRDDAAVIYAHQAMKAATDVLLDIRAERRRPPDAKRQTRKFAYLDLAKRPTGLGLKFGESWMDSLKYALRSTLPIQDYTNLDKAFNAWLAVTYSEFESVEGACVALCGEQDAEISHYRELAPRNMHYSHGILNSKTGLVANIKRRISNSDE